MNYETIIGLEVHAQLLTGSKIFCACSTIFGGEPNKQVCPICLGMPGVLPVLNKEVINLGISTALALNCKINPISRFSRKNYFYPDLPKNYQISQYDEPLAEHGFLNIKQKQIRIKRVHIEEDAGKLIHMETNSHVDFNRTGVPLLEIVSEPDLTSSDEAFVYMKALRDILVYLKACDGNMEEGSLRCDANISLRKKGEINLGVKVEIKNLNSFKHVKNALEFEIKRQEKILDQKNKIIQETRSWDTAVGETKEMRSKEEAHDYRYFSEPDLAPLEISESWIEERKKLLPELAREKLNRFIKEYNLPIYDSEILTGDINLANYFEECVKIYNNPKAISNWIMSEVLRKLNEENIFIPNNPITPKHLTELIKLIDDQTISGKIAKTVFEECFKTKKFPSEIIKEKNLTQEKDEAVIDNLINQVLNSHNNEVALYQKGKTGLFGFFMGEAMKLGKGKINPEILRDKLKEKLTNQN
jgi:aspartyl-tRNA(Asn)/glutamyl-tRNA(Gln) amidotransferase subunit B